MFTSRVMTNYLKLAHRCTTHDLWYKTKFITLYGIINFRSVQNQEEKLPKHQDEEIDYVLSGQPVIFDPKFIDQW